MMPLPPGADENRIICALPKAQWADLFWLSDHGGVRDLKPKHPTVNGDIVGDDLAAALPQFPNETMLARATRRGLLDTWTPHLIVQFAANHSLRYSGGKALRIWKAWQAIQFGKKKT